MLDKSVPMRPQAQPIADKPRHQGFRRTLERLAHAAAAPLAALTLVGCAHVPPLSLPALAAIDFETTDFADLRVAVDLPRQIVPLAEGVRMAVTLTIDGAIAHERSYVLVDTTPSAETPPSTPGRAIYAYGLSGEDQRGMDAIRAAVADARAKQQGGSLAVQFRVEKACASGAVPDGPLPVDVYLRTSETGSYVRTLDGFDLREVPSGAVATLDDLEPCPM